MHFDAFSVKIKRYIALYIITEHFYITYIKNKCFLKDKSSSELTLSFIYL